MKTILKLNKTIGKKTNIIVPIIVVVISLLELLCFKPLETIFVIEYVYMSFLSVIICFFYLRSENKNVMSFLAEIYIVLAVIMTFVIRHFVDNQFVIWIMCFALIAIIAAILGIRIKNVKE